MLYAVLSDIHSNLAALKAVLEAAKRRGAEGTIVLGDTVGYGAEPNECLDLLRELEPSWIIAGNHDLAALGKMDLDWFNPVAAEAIVWTRKVLTKASQAMLERLPLRAAEQTFTAVHGSPRNPAEEYLLTPRQFLDNLEHYRTSPCFIGHTHLPLFFELLEKKRGGPQVRAEAVEGDGRFEKGEGPCMINPGSVGQPRDLDPRASFGLYDDRAGAFEWLRVEYPVEAAQRKIREAGLPEFLAARLETGR